MNEPPVRYYVMGDVIDPQAPGNEWRTSPTWPVPAKTTSYYLNSGGTLSEQVTERAREFRQLQIRSKNPVRQSAGQSVSEKGPMDQRAIGERSDLLKFATPVLQSPLKSLVGSQLNCGPKAMRVTLILRPSSLTFIPTALRGLCSTPFYARDFAKASITKCL
jgi:predicted acyl esterase